MAVVMTTGSQVDFQVPAWVEEPWTFCIHLIIHEGIWNIGVQGKFAVMILQWEGGLALQGLLHGCHKG